MANSFNKEERVAFEDVLEKFNDAMVLSQNVAVFNTDQTMMERTNDVIWRPMSYIATSNDGTDATANFNAQTQLAVPATIGYAKHSAWTMSATELRDALQEGRLGEAARQKLASDINVSVMNVASLQGTKFVKRVAAASGFDDVAVCEAVFNEIGVPSYDRYLALSTRDYNGMAGNLAGRQTMTGKPQTAYEKAYVGTVASFETYKMDYARRQAAAAGGAGITINTTAAGGNYYTPRATSTAATGEVQNVDNRYQRVTVNTTANVVAGDAFTISGVESVHLITKQSTGQNQTFRVISVDSLTTMTISPPIISNQGGTQAEAQYQNVSVTANAGASITFLNTAAGYLNPFWHKSAIELLPGRYAVPSNAGVAVMRGTTDQGIELVMQKFYDINTMVTKYRIDTRWGVVMNNPEFCGVMMFSQP